MKEAIEILKQSTSVEDWNAKMSQLSLTQAERATIESSGLIVQVLGKDK